MSVVQPGQVWTLRGRRSGAVACPGVFVVARVALGVVYSREGADGATTVFFESDFLRLYEPLVSIERCGYCGSEIKRKEEVQAL